MADAITELLQKIERGEISAQEGLRRLNAMENGDPEAAASEVVDASQVEVVIDNPGGETTASKRQAEAEKDRLSEAGLEQELSRWKRWWTIPFWIGVVITLVSAGLMYWGFSAAGLSWGFWLAWIPFWLGTAILTVAWRSQAARWLHVRIRQKPGEKPARIAISMPLPLGFAAWVVRTFGKHIPNMKDQEIGLILETLDQAFSSQTPLYIHVNEDDEDVQVYIG